MEHLVSIVVPVYNAERYLCTSIHALQKQDYSNIEIILLKLPTPMWCVEP